MKLKDYAKTIASLAKRYPDANVICASDDEGNSYQMVSYDPTLGNYNDANREFSTDVKKEPNAICVN